MTANRPAEPVAGGTVVFRGPAAGAGAAPLPQTLALDADGHAAATLTANQTVGTYRVTATAGGASTDFNLTNAAATAAITRTGPALTNTASVTFAVRFSQAVTGLTAADFRLAGAGSAGAVVTSVAGTGDSYAVTVAAGADGALQLLFADPDRSVSPQVGDAAGEAVTVDRTPPAATVAAGSGARFTVTFTEPVAGFGPAGVELSGTAAGLAAAAVTVSNPSGDGRTFVVDVGGTGPGAVTLTVRAGAAADAAGNPNPASAGATATLGTVSAQPLTLATDEDAPVSGRATASDPTGGPVTFALLSGPANGSAEVHADGTFTYRPTANFNGTDTFVVRATNARGGTADTVVTVVVRPVNDAPSFGPNPTVIAVGPGGLTTPPAVASDPDAGDRLTFSLAGGPGGVTVDPATGAVTFPPGLPPGHYALTLTVTDLGGLSASRTLTAQVGFAAQTTVTTFAAGSASGGEIKVYGPGGEQVGALTAFAGESLPGGVRVAVADVTGDGVPDVIAGTGPGVRGRVQIFDGVTRQVIRTFDAFEASFTGGTFVTAADFDGDGRVDVVVTPDVSGGPRVTVFGADGLVLADFYGIDDQAFRGGARAGVGDVNGDGVPDLIVSAGRSGGPRVAVFDGRTLRPGQTPQKLVEDFFVFEPSLRDGAYVTAGDLDGDGFAELVAGGGPGGGPRVLALSGADLMAGAGGELPGGGELPRRRLRLTQRRAGGRQATRRRRPRRPRRGRGRRQLRRGRRLLRVGRRWGRNPGGAFQVRR